MIALRTSRRLWPATLVALLVLALALPLAAAAQVVVHPSFVSLTDYYDGVGFFTRRGEAVVTNLGDDPVSVGVRIVDQREGTFGFVEYGWDGSSFVRCDATGDTPSTSLWLEGRGGWNSRTVSICGIPVNPLSTSAGARLQVFDPTSTPATARAPSFSPIDVFVDLLTIPVVAFEVDSEADGTDADPGDGACETAQGACTLRAAVMEANADPVQNLILLEEGTFTLSLAGPDEDAAATGDLDVTESVLLFGAGADRTIVDGGGLDRVFEIHGGFVEVEGIAVRNGLVEDANGGGIRVADGSRLLLHDCAVSGNQATSGGGIFSEGILDVQRCSVTGNRAVAGGGIAGAEPMMLPGAPVPLVGTPEIALTNVTVSDNVADPNSAGGVHWLMPADPGSVLLEYVTITDNQGGGLAGACPDCILMRGSIVANQRSGPDCVDAGTSEAYSMDSDGSCAMDALTDLPTGDPLLGPLEANGGHALTHALLPGSPALNTVQPADCIWDQFRNLSATQRLTKDQRHAPRPQSTGCDVGAFEVQPTLCAAAPLMGCVAAGKASLFVKEKKAGKERLTAALKKLAEPVTQADFGDPVDGTTRFDLCVYDGQDELVGELVVDRARSLCGPKDKPCWKAQSDKGFKYKDPDASAAGVRQIALKGGDSGKGRLGVKAGNKEKKNQRSMPTGFAAELEGESQVTLQAVASGGKCFEATLPNIKKDDGLLFKATLP